MFGIGGFELFIIVVFIFVVFGPDKLPEIIKIISLGIKKFKKAKAEMDTILKEEIVEPVMKEVNKDEENSKPPRVSEKITYENDSIKTTNDISISKNVNNEDLEFEETKEVNS